MGVWQTDKHHRDSPWLPGEPPQNRKQDFAVDEFSDLAEKQPDQHHQGAEIDGGQPADIQFSLLQKIATSTPIKPL